MILIISIGLSSGTYVFGMEPKELQQQKLETLEKATEQLYEYMQRGDAARSQAQLGIVVETVKSISFKGLTSIEGIHELAASIMDVQQAIVRVSYVKEDWQRSSASLRLAVNSMLHHKEGLWLNYHKVMVEHMEQMNTAIAKRDSKQLQLLLQQFSESYHLIRPAAVMVRDSSTISQFDSWISYVSKLSQESKTNWDTWKGLMSQGEQSLQQLFGKNALEPVFLPVVYDRHPWYIVMLIGSWIILSLLYTAWRKYQGEQDIVTLP